MALCPGAEFGPAKRWPERHYTVVAEHFINLGWQVALFGSTNDQVIAEKIKSAVPEDQQQHCISLASATALAEAVDILSHASAVVSNDSGLVHIAAALNRLLAVVYGSTSPKFAPPLSDNVIIEQLEVDCGPCFKREYPLTEKETPLKCLLDLKPEKVIPQLETLL